jgi:flavin-dependent dehydrogenase
VVADGVRSPLGKVLGREWHRDTVYGVAGRSYVSSELSDDPWISSHLELRDEAGKVLSGYGWIFPLGTGEVNLGVGTLATSKRPAELAIKPLMPSFAARTSSCPAGCGRRPRRCCRWAVRSATSPAPTGR